MTVDLRLGDCLEVLPTLPDNSIDLIATDPPYYRVKGEAWDRQWDDAAAFLAWIGRLCDEWQRILKPNGSLYVFASPRMAARVEVEIGKRFNVLNSITWAKPGSCFAQKYGPENFRGYVEMSERIIFAEHYGADNIAKGEAGYGAKCDELRGFVFEPLRAYLDGERRRAGVDFEQVRQVVGCAAGSGLPSHWFTQSQWMLPTEPNYLKLRDGFHRLNHGGAYLQRPYEYLRREYEDLRREYEDLRREYEDLRREYEDLRRPFSVTADVPYTDVWTFPTVAHYPGKHPCEKPVAMMRHIVTASSKPGAMVLDCFMGGGSTGVAAVQEGRHFIGVEISETYYRQAEQRIAEAQMQPALMEVSA